MDTPNNFISESPMSLFITSIFVLIFYALVPGSWTEIVRDCTWVNYLYTSVKSPSSHYLKYFRCLWLSSQRRKLGDHLRTLLLCMYQYVCYTQGRFGEYSTLWGQRFTPEGIPLQLPSNHSWCLFLSWLCSFFQKNMTSYSLPRSRF